MNTSFFCSFCSAQIFPIWKYIKRKLIDERTLPIPSLITGFQPLHGSSQQLLGFLCLHGFTYTKHIISR